MASTTKQGTGQQRERLLAVRAALKKRKPAFVTPDAKVTPAVKKRWRYPQGRRSAFREGQGGRPARPSPGYRSPRAVRGLHPSGLEAVVVHTVAQLEALTPEQGALFAGTLGQKARVQLLRLAQQKSIPVLNARDVAKTLRELEEAFAQRRKRKEEKLKEKGQKAVEREKKKAAEKKSEKSNEKAEGAEAANAPGAAAEEAPSELEKKREEERKMMEQTITKRQ
ncbi:MAG TPA: eL32 family ribosomal protein [Candidatus Nanoarchaeia archaeon]|nr:eL32 family ribosomal protein [Candidatus Nanoarchaeia archaeon]